MACWCHSFCPEEHQPEPLKAGASSGTSCPADDWSHSACWCWSISWVTWARSNSSRSASMWLACSALWGWSESCAGFLFSGFLQLAFWKSFRNRIRYTFVMRRHLFKTDLIFNPFLLGTYFDAKFFPVFLQLIYMKYCIKNKPQNSLHFKNQFIQFYKMMWFLRFKKF